MQKRIGTIVQRALIGLLAASLLLAGCKATPQATPTSPVGASTAESASQGEVRDGVEQALDNLLKLAPVHFTSSFVYKQGDQVVNQASLQGDLDAQGNEHLLITDQNGQKTEIYLVEGILYLKSGRDADFMTIVDMPSGSAFSFLANFGGAYLLGFNQLEAARKLRDETVNGFETAQYAIEQNSASFGISSLLADAEGDVEWDYTGHMWVEPTSKAMIRASVVWTAKAAEQKESYEAEFNAVRGTVTAIQAPKNLAKASQPAAGATPAGQEASGSSEPAPTAENPPAEPPPAEGSAPTAIPAPTQDPSAPYPAPTEEPVPTQDPGSVPYPVPVPPSGEISTPYP